MIFIYQLDYEKIKENISLLNKNDYLVLKSNAYGFGFKKVLKLAINLNMRKFALIDINDCIYIKKNYPEAIVLLLGPINKNNLFLCEKYQIIVTITSLDEIELLLNYKLNIQIEINSGMNRFGIRDYQFDEAIKLLENSSLTLFGIYSHNATKDLKHINKQMEVFNNVIKNKDMLDFHFQSSSLNDLTYLISKRIGNALYKDALRVSGKIIKINYCYKGEYIGYDYSYQFEKDSYVGVIDVGYADGLDRYCGGFKVYIKDKYYPLIGRACMNNCFVLLDDAIFLNEEVVFIGKENNIRNYESFFNKISHEVYLSFLKK